MRKRIVIIACFACCIILLVGGCLFAYLRQETNQIAKFSVFPTGTYEGSYYFTLNSEGFLICTLGLRAGDDISVRNFIREPEKTEKKKLSRTDFQRLIELANKLDASEYNWEKTVAVDSWDIAFVYNEKIYAMNYDWDNNSPILPELVDVFIELSPIVINFD